MIVLSIFVVILLIIIWALLNVIGKMSRHITYLELEKLDLQAKLLIAGLIFKSIKNRR
jgi:hypothetical protein